MSLASGGDQVPDNNLAIWQAFGSADPDHVSEATGKGYKCSSVRPHWVVLKMTEMFGACGIGWGWEILDERFAPMPDLSLLHIARVSLWYIVRETKPDGSVESRRGCIEQLGQTKASYQSNSGKWIVDEDAPKKSVTDAMTKCCSYLGIASDIYLGMWNDDKYVANVRRDAADGKTKKSTNAAVPKAAPVVESQAPIQNAVTVASKPPSNEQLAECAITIETATNDAVLANQAKVIWMWSQKPDWVPVAHLRELSASVMARRSELVASKDYPALKKMADTFVRQSLITQSQATAMLGLARSRLNIVE